MNRYLKWGLNILGLYYKLKCRKDIVTKYLNKKDMINSGNCLYIDKKKIRIAAVQVQAKPMKSVKEYVEYIFRKVKISVKEGAQLIVFPENNGIQLLGLIPSIEKIAAHAIGDEEDTSDNNGEGLSIGNVFKAVGPSIEEVYKTLFMRLAKEFGVYIIGGSIVAPDANRELYNTAYLFGPDGNIAGKQDKLHLMPIEREWGIKEGTEITIHDTKLGKLAFPVCMDATYFETFRLLEAKGAEIVAIPIANPEEFNYWLALRGIWPRVQESMVYGVKSALVGDFLGMKFTGKSGIFSNIDLTEAKDGVIAESRYYDKEDIVIGEVDLLKLNSFRDESQIYGDKNYELYEKYLPRLYQR